MLCFCKQPKIKRLIKFCWTKEILKPWRCNQKCQLYCKVINGIIFVTRSQLKMSSIYQLPFYAAYNQKTTHAISRKHVLFKCKQWHVQFIHCKTRYVSSIFHQKFLSNANVACLRQSKIMYCCGGQMPNIKNEQMKQILTTTSKFTYFLATW